MIYGGDGADTIDGGIGNDTLYGGNDADTFQLSNSFGTDSIQGGEGGTDYDTIDASALTSAVTVTLTGNEAGSLTGTQGTANFTQIEAFVLTQQADTFNGAAASTPVTVDGLGGNDTLTGGSAPATTCSMAAPATTRSTAAPAATPWSAATATTRCSAATTPTASC